MAFNSCRFKHLWTNHKPRLLLLLAIVAMAPLGHTADIFYAPSAAGGATGANCANAKALTGTLGLVAGDIAHLCAGSYTGSQAATIATISANGTSGSRITLTADQAQVVVSSPAWGTNVAGAFNITGNFITVDGVNVGQYLITNSSQSGTTATFNYTKISGADVSSGKIISIAGTKNGSYKFNGTWTVATANASQFTVTFASATVSSAAEAPQAQAIINNLVIENTLNGSAGGACLGGACTLQVATLGINATGDSYIIKNVTVTHMYVHTEGELSAQTDDQNTAISTEGNNGLVTRNAIDHVYNGISYSPTTATTAEEFSWNTIQLCNHCITGATDTQNFSGLVLQFNDISSMYIWDTPTNRYHHNGVFMFTNGTISGTIMNGNYIHGMMSRDAVYGATHVTGWAFIEFCQPGFLAYNNVFQADPDSGGTPLNNPSNGYFTIGTNCGGTTQGLWNNTIIGQHDAGNCDNGGVSGLDWRNNIQEDCGNPLFNATASSPFTYDNNIYFWNATSGDSWKNGTAGAAYPSLSTWQASCSCDTHSTAQVNPNLTTGYVPQTGSIAIGAGVTIAGAPASWRTGPPQVFGAAGFCGTGCLARAASGAQDVGAYPFSGAASSSPGAPASWLFATLINGKTTVH